VKAAAVVRARLLFVRFSFGSLSHVCASELRRKSLNHNRACIYHKMVIELDKRICREPFQVRSVDST
jgi:hypothetical protein